MVAPVLALLPHAGPALISGAIVVLFVRLTISAEVADQNLRLCPRLGGINMEEFGAGVESIRMDQGRLLLRCGGGGGGSAGTCLLTGWCDQADLSR